MTEKRIFTKFLSIISAAAISCSWAAGSTVPAARAESPEIVDWENDEMLPVIVRVRGDAVLASDEAAEEGADLIDTEEGGKLAGAGPECSEYRRRYRRHAGSVETTSWRSDYPSR